MTDFYSIQYGSTDPHGIESGFMSKKKQENIDAEIEALQKQFKEQSNNPWKNYDISKEKDHLYYDSNYHTPQLTIAISALQKSNNMQEAEEARQRAKQQAKYGIGSDMHRHTFETYKKM